MQTEHEARGMRRVLGGVVAILLMVVLVIAGFKMWENVPANKILVVQAPFSGKLTWYTEPGTVYQGGGDLTWYDKMSNVDFKKKLMFNDNGTGEISGKFQIEMPLDSQNLTDLHTRYGSMEAIKNNLIQAVLDSVIIATGPTMSSKESSAESRNDLMRYIVDQLEHGIYRMRTVTKRVEDPLDPKNTREIRAAEIIMKDGHLERQGESPLAEFGLKVVNFAPSDIDYDKRVEEQIAKQQEITMDVQTSRAEATKAEQRRLTAEAEGKTKVTQAEYARLEQKIAAETDAKRDYEVALTQARQQKDVAEQKKLAASFYKQEQILKGEGDSAYKELVMKADGALQQKLQAFVEVNGRYAKALEAHRLVPDIVMGNDGKSGNSAASDFIEMMKVKTARDLHLDMTVQK